MEAPEPTAVNEPRYDHLDVHAGGVTAEIDETKRFGSERFGDDQMSPSLGSLSRRMPAHTSCAL